MKRWLAIVVLAVGIIVPATMYGQYPPPGNPPPPNNYPFDLGPRAQGATLRQPALETPSAGMPTQLKGLWNPAAGPDPGRAFPKDPARPGGRLAQLPKNQVDINRDIEVNDRAGRWLILAMTYVGDDAPQRARPFVIEMLNNPKYQIKNAYVFNYGAKEKEAEYRRAEAEREKQREALRRCGLKTDMPIRVPVAKINEQTGVLLGGYNTREEALAVLERLRKSPPPDPTKVDLDTEYVHENPEWLEKNKTARQDKQEYLAYVNPFRAAFPVRNPCIPAEDHAAENAAADLDFLRKLNADEPFSLFACKKPLTLVIKQYQMSMLLKKSSEPSGFFGGMFGWGREAKRPDYAAMNAHNVAEAFRKAGLPETYVLHSRYCSYVTVGGYDDVNDPNLLGMQNALRERFQTEGMRSLDLLPQPLPMAVPH